MNITRENLGELDLCIKIDVAENDYAEKVAKQLKEYKQKAAIPGFRKGMAPMGMIQRLYKPTVVADAVQDLLSESLYKYIEDEKLDIIGYEGTDNQGFWAQLSDMMIYACYALVAGVVGCIVWGAIYTRVKK